MALLSVFGIPSVQGQDGNAKIQSAFQSFTSNPALENGIASLTVLNAKTGDVVFQGNSKIGLPTASTLKVITSITALDLLGPDYTFETNLYYAGAIDSLGILNGDLIIEGSGDPTLGSEHYPENTAEAILNKWKQAIRELGIKGINGKIIAQDDLYNGYTAPGSWTWSDLGNYYGAGISSLNWRENKLGVKFTPAKTGQPARLDSINIPPYFTLINEVITGNHGSGDNVYAYSAPYSTVVYLRGSYGSNLNKTIEISNPNPSLGLEYELKNSLFQDSIMLTDTLASFANSSPMASENSTKKDRTLIMTVHSPKLSEIVHWFNQKSINLYGEALLKLIGGISSNKYDTNESANLVAKYWQNKLKINPSEINIYDGSGLSPQNRVTTKAIAKIMQYARERPWFESFTKSLPTINGMQMKSGTIGGALGYTGYQKSAAGNEYTFSLLVNNYQGPASRMRQNMFKLLDVLK